MYTIVIADDEEELRRAIIRTVDWEGIGFQVVGEAENGIEALELVEKKKPDLLLTDIRMPFITGIELARQVREIRPTTHIAFLSGFDEFTYAQQAIQYNIISYMLKPISMADLTKELIVIKEKIDNVFHEFSKMQQTQIDKFGFLMPLLLDGFQTDSLEVREKKLVKQAVESGLLQDEHNDFRYVVITTMVRNDQGEIYTSQAHVHAVDIILKKYVKYVSFYWEGRIISLLLATPAAFEHYLHILVEDITQSMEKIMKLYCSLGVSRVAPNLSGCHDAYIEAMNAISYSKHSVSSVHYIADEERMEGIDAEGILNIVTEVENLIRGGSEQELAIYLKKLFETIYEKRIPRVKINYLLMQLMASVCKIIYAVADEEEMQELQSNTLLQRISFLEGSLKESQNKFIEFCLNAREIIGMQRKKSSKVLCERARQIIESDYGSSDLSLVSISNEINVSPNYLSALIKKETGQTFIDLLSQKRIQIAKELLLCTSMKIREISEKCGYSDQHYFSYCFKKYSGVSPNVLRQQAKDEEKD